MNPPNVHYLIGWAGAVIIIIILIIGWVLHDKYTYEQNDKKKD